MQISEDASSGGFYASLTYKYVGRQFSTFINDETIPRFQTFDAAMGYKLPDIGALKSPVIRFTVTNIRNKPYISTLAAPQPNAVATRGVNGTLLPGVAPTYYVGATRAALLTLSTDLIGVERAAASASRSRRLNSAER